MSQRIYIDVKAGIGRTNFREERIPYKVETLLEEMKYYRIHASLLYNREAIDYAFTNGNQRLIQNISENRRLYAVACVIPGIQYELEEGFGYYDQLLKKGVKAFKLYPKTMNFILARSIWNNWSGT